MGLAVWQTIANRSILFSRQLIATLKQVSLAPLDTSSGRGASGQPVPATAVDEVDETSGRCHEQVHGGLLQPVALFLKVHAADHALRFFVHELGQALRVTLDL